MPKFLKSRSLVFMFMLLVTLSLMLLPGRGQDKGGDREERVSPRSRRDREGPEREPQGDKDSKDRELRGIVRGVDRDKGVILVELSAKDSERFDRASAEVKIDRDTKFRGGNNSREEFRSIREGAPVRVKIDRESDMKSSWKVGADRIKLEIACKDGQGCPKNGECARACKSDACTCPLPKRSSSSRN